MLPTQSPDVGPPVSAPVVVPVVPKEMLSWRVLPDGRWSFRLNFSSLSVLQECSRKAEYLLVRKLKVNAEGEALTFGTAIHKGLEVFYRGARTERNFPPHADDIIPLIGAGNWDEAWSHSLIFRSLRAFVTEAGPLTAVPAGAKHSVAAGVWLLSHYFRTYLTDPFVIYEDEKGPFVERDFSYPYYESEDLKIELFGRIDFVLRNEQTGVILPGDHKTTSMLGSQFYDRLHPNFQYTLYLLAAREVFGLKTDSFLVNALQKKEMPKTSRGSPPQFARQVTSRTDHDFTELKRAVISACQTFRYHNTQGFYPQTAPGPCASFAGCQYRPVCSAPINLRENIISAQFRSPNDAR